jgi:hypothetical protein
MKQLRPARGLSIAVPGLLFVLCTDQSVQTGP